MLEDFLTQGNVTSIADLNNTYINVCFSNGVDSSTRLKSKRELKAFLEEEVPGFEISVRRQKNESERVFLKETKTIAIGKLEDGAIDEQLKVLFSAVKILRKAAWNAKR